MSEVIRYKLMVPGLTLASGVLDCESDEQQMGTQEWCSDASALRSSEVHNNTSVIVVTHLSTSLQLLPQLSVPTLTCGYYQLLQYCTIKFHLQTNP